MKTRILGKNGLEVSALGLGCMGMSWSYSPSDKQEMMLCSRGRGPGRNVLRYGRSLRPAPNEELVGEALAPFRGEVVIATKFGFDTRARGRAREPPRQPARPHQEGRGRIAQRLRVEAIDLLYQHRVDPNVPIEDVAGAVKELIQQGKVKHFGLSEAGARPSDARTPCSR